MNSHRLEIRLLGPLDVLEEGIALELPSSRKARALLAYLVTTRRAHGRSALCDLLWKEVVDPRAGLRWALSKIRPVVDRGRDTRIVTPGSRVAFDPEGVGVDLEFVRAAASDAPAQASTDDLEKAVCTIRGEFLEDLDLPDCHEYQTWCLGVREQTRRWHLSIRERLVDRLRADPDAALHHALVRIRLDPISEEAYVAAIELLGELARVGPGLELYEQCRRMLSEDLGATPSPALLAARRRLRRAGGGRARDAPPASGPAVAGEPSPVAPSDYVHGMLADLPAPDSLPEPGPRDPPLVGRAHELETLTHVARGADPRFRHAAVLVAGEPGIGKTRLLRELVHEVRSAGGWVLAGPVFENEEIRPYGPWIDLIRSLPTSVLQLELAPDLDALLSEPRPGTPEPGPAERAQLFEAVARLLAGLAEARPPGLVVLDDLHWLDASSAALLHYAVRTLADAPLRFALAAREEEIERGSAPARVIRSLKEMGLLQRLPLRRLDATETETLVRSVDTAADGGRIFAASEGNPLFALAVAGSLREGSDRTPTSIEEEVGARLDRLDRRALSLLPWAAALGRAFDVPTLLHVVDRPAAEVAEDIDHLERRGVLRVNGADRYDFTHSLLRRAAYRRPSEPVRRMIHRSIARALDGAQASGQRSPGAVAHHAELGGLSELAARSYRDAAEHSLWLIALDEAAAQIVRGLAQLEALPDEERVPLEMGLLRLYGFRSMRDGRPPELEDRVRRVIDDARRLSLRGVAAVGHACLMELEYQRGAFQDAAQSSRRSAEAGRESDPVIAIRALAETAACLLLLDQAPDDARRLASEATSLARAHEVEMDVVALAQALLHHHEGRLDEAVEAFQEVVRLGRRARDRWWECPALTRMIMVELDRGDPQGALARAREAEGLAERLGDETEAAFARGLRGVASALAPIAMDGGVGLEAIDTALHELRVLDSLWTVGHLQAYAAEVELERGRAGAAYERAEEAARAARTIDQPSLLALALSLLARCAAPTASVDGAAPHFDLHAVARPVQLLSHRARTAMRRVGAQTTDSSTPAPSPAPTEAG